MAGAGSSAPKPALLWAGETTAQGGSWGAPGHRGAPGKQVQTLLLLRGIPDGRSPPPRSPSLRLTATPGGDQRPEAWLRQHPGLPGTRDEIGRREEGEPHLGNPGQSDPGLRRQLTGTNESLCQPPQAKPHPGPPGDPSGGWGLGSIFHHARGGRETPGLPAQGPSGGPARDGPCLTCSSELTGSGRQHPPG